MKFKGMMLVTLVLLAILTIGAVSASDNLTVEDGLTASDTEDNPIEESSVDDVVADDPPSTQYTADDFNFFNRENVGGETTAVFSLYTVPDYGNLTFYVNGNLNYNGYIGGKSPYKNFYAGDLGIDEDGKYNIRAEYIVESSGQVVLLKEFDADVYAMPVLISVSSIDIDVADEYFTPRIGSVYDEKGIVGTVVAYIDGNQVFNKQYSASDNKNSVYIEDFKFYDGFALGNRTVKIVYSKSSKQYSKEGNVMFYADPNIVNNGYGMTEGDNRFITVNYYKGATGTLVVYNTVKDSTVSTGWKKTDVFMTIDLNGNGTASIPLNTMSAGYHGFCLNITLGTYSVEKYVDINVNEKQDTRPSPNLAIDVKDIKFGEDATVTITADSAFSGKVLVTIEDVRLNVTVKNGAGSDKVSNLSAGDHLAIVVFTADENSEFKSHNNFKYFTVEKAWPAFRVDDYKYDLVYGDTLNLNVTTGEGVIGFIAKLDGEDANVSGNVILISNLGIGNHMLKITSITDANHKEDEQEVNIKVSKAQSKIVADDEISLVKGNFKNITVSIEGATGFTAKIDSIAAAVSGNVVEIPDSLDVGTHTVTITTIPDENHTAATKDIALTVKKLPSAVSINGDLAFDYGSSASCEVSYANATGVKAEVVGHSEASVVVDNKIITVSGLNAGKYTLMVTTIVDDNYEPATATANITVNKIKTSVSIRDSNIVFDYGSSNFTYVTSDVKFAAKVVGQSKAKVEIDGNKITVSGLDAGSYVLEVTTDDENYETAMATANITVNQIATKVTPSSTKVTTTYGTSKNIVVTLNDINGNPIEGKRIILTLNGKQYPKTTNGKGQATIAIPNNLAVKNAYSATIAFAGDVNYAKSTGKVSVVVNKATPKLVYKAASFKRTVKTKQYTVTLKTDKNAVYKNAKVSLTVNKKTFSGKTNSKGQVTFKITNLSKNGKYTATIKFAGDAKYKAVSKSVKLTVK